MGKNELISTVVALSLALTVLGAAWLILDNGIGQSYEVVTGDNANISAGVNTTYGGDVGFTDRVVTLGAFFAILGPAGMGAISVSRNNPKAVNDLVKWMPLIVGFVGLIAMGDMVNEMLSGDYDWDANSDGTNALNTFVTGSVIGGVSRAIGWYRVK